MHMGSMVIIGMGLKKARQIPKYMVFFPPHDMIDMSPSKHCQPSAIVLDDWVGPMHVGCKCDPTTQ